MTLYEAAEFAKDLNALFMTASEGTHLRRFAYGGHYQVRFFEGKWMTCYHHAENALPSECEGCTAGDRLEIVRQRIDEMTPKLLS